MAKTMFPLLILIFLVSACTAEPETIIQTVVHETTVEVPVTVEIEITREVEMPVTVEVTHEVEVTREVTRIVEQVVTVTPKPTPEPTAEAAATPAPADTQVAAPAAAPAPATDLADTLLETAYTVRGEMQSFGGQVDAGLNGSAFYCDEAVYRYDFIGAAPTYDVSGSSPEVQTAYGQYRAGIDLFASGTWDLTNNCREFLDNPDGGGSIPWIQWSVARQNLDKAVGLVSQAIVNLGGVD